MAPPIPLHTSACAAVLEPGNGYRSEGSLIPHSSGNVLPGPAMNGVRTQIDPAMCMNNKEEYRNLERRSPFSRMSRNEDAAAVEPSLRGDHAGLKRHSVVGGHGPQGEVFRSAVILAARVVGATLVVARQRPLGRPSVAKYPGGIPVRRGAARCHALGRRLSGPRIVPWRWVVSLTFIPSSAGVPGADGVAWYPRGYPYDAGSGSRRA